jgi:hypothetical protein
MSRAHQLAIEAATAPRYHYRDMNCHDAHVLVGEPDDELHYGWAVAPDGVRYQHCWLVRACEKIDIFGWTQHEDLGVRLRIEPTRSQPENPNPIPVRREP